MVEGTTGKGGPFSGHIGEQLAGGNLKAIDQEIDQMYRSESNQAKGDEVISRRDIAARVIFYSIESLEEYAEKQDDEIEEWLETELAQEIDLSGSHTQQRFRQHFEKIHEQTGMLLQTAENLKTYIKHRDDINSSNTVELVSEIEKFLNQRENYLKAILSALSNGNTEKAEKEYHEFKKHIYRDEKVMERDLQGLL
jgi:AraC-like DNA-binding protein